MNFSIMDSSKEDFLQILSKSDFFTPNLDAKINALLDDIYLKTVPLIKEYKSSLISLPLKERRAKYKEFKKEHLEPKEKELFNLFNIKQNSGRKQRKEKELNEFCKGI